MGAFKPLLPFGDQTVIESCVGNLREGGVEWVVVVVGYRGDEIRERLAHLPVLFAVNPDPKSEMSASIARGMGRVPSGAEAVFVALGDQPAVSPEVIRLLIDQRKKTGARLLVPEYEGRGGHPVLLDRSFRHQLLNLDPQGGLRALLDEHRDEVLRVAVAAPYVARDMDTWEDYLALHEEVFGSQPPGTKEAPPRS
jgi:CTP:molybdopterin cytidylyltransferase MocA